MQLERARDQILDLYNAVEDARAAQTKFEDIATKAGIPIVIGRSSTPTASTRMARRLKSRTRMRFCRRHSPAMLALRMMLSSRDDAYVWYEVREVTPSALRPFDEVKDKVKAD